MSAGIKALDPHHMVTTGVEVRCMTRMPAYKCVFACDSPARSHSHTQGFFGASTPERLRDNPYSGTSEGADFRRNHDIDTIDYTTAHGAAMRQRGMLAMLRVAHTRRLSPLCCWMQCGRTSGCAATIAASAPSSASGM
jgi:hypothetical protein